MLMVDCARATIGKPSVAAPVAATAAPVRNLRRGTSVVACGLLISHPLVVGDLPLPAIASPRRPAAPRELPTGIPPAQTAAILPLKMTSPVTVHGGGSPDGSDALRAHLLGHLRGVL